MTTRRDPLTRAERSALMSRIRSKNTTPERIVRSALHSLGFRFRLHVVALPGRPDVVLPKYRTVVFVHGCFWHQHRHCRYATIPTTRRVFWIKKFQANRARDTQVQGELRRLSWRVVVIWECATVDPQVLRSQLMPLVRHRARVCR